MLLISLCSLHWDDKTDNLCDLMNKISILLYMLLLQLQHIFANIIVFLHRIDGAQRQLLRRKAILHIFIDRFLHEKEHY